MQREILFRGIAKHDKRWEYGFYYVEYGTGNNYITCGDGTAIEVIPESVGEFTGLTDKNGVRIFEGDLLKNFEYPVTFEDGCFCATIQYDLVRCWLNSDECNLETLEVIGNIHDKHVL